MRLCLPFSSSPRTKALFLAYMTHRHQRKLSCTAPADFSLRSHFLVCAIQLTASARVYNCLYTLHAPAQYKFIAPLENSAPTASFADLSQWWWWYKYIVVKSRLFSHIAVQQQQQQHTHAERSRTEQAQRASYT